MQVLILVTVLLAGLNCILVAVVIFILKQPDPNKGREVAEIRDTKERLMELSKQLVSFDKRVEKLFQESKGEYANKLDAVKKEVGTQLQKIQENL